MEAAAAAAAAAAVAGLPQALTQQSHDGAMVALGSCLQPPLALHPGGVGAKQGGVSVAKSAGLPDAEQEVDDQKMEARGAEDGTRACAQGTSADAAAAGAASARTGEVWKEV